MKKLIFKPIAKPAIHTPFIESTDEEKEAESPRIYKASREIAKLLGIPSSEAEELIDTLTLESVSSLYQNEVEQGIQNFIHQTHNSKLKTQLADILIAEKIYQILVANQLARKEKSFGWNSGNISTTKIKTRNRMGA